MKSLNIDGLASVQATVDKINAIMGLMKIVAKPAATYVEVAAGWDQCMRAGAHVRPFASQLV
eukprot:10062844-Lingulodinium_polyedra.AAC.1